MSEAHHHCSTPGASTSTVAGTTSAGSGGDGGENPNDNELDPFALADAAAVLNRKFNSTSHTRMVDEQYRAIQSISRTIRSKNRNKLHDLAKITKGLVSLQIASRAKRATYAVEAEKVFMMTKKYRPLVPKATVKRGKAGKKKEKETPAVQPKKESQLAKERASNAARNTETPVAVQSRANVDETPAAATPTTGGKGKRKTTTAAAHASGTTTPQPSSSTASLSVASSSTTSERKQSRKESAAAAAAKKRTSNRLSKTPRVVAKEEEETYCFCNRISFGDMVGCDNDKCEIEWFHFECIGLKVKPKGKWYCPNCRHPESHKIQKGAASSTKAEKKSE